eukprot:TRINITY_DN7106_c0_g1_i2.p1 TRINITY_DN7106_c0_g1~~TRINITY_DN7106_c0_g1_i2.p1  ORF type:complete len:909 (+),score=169.99 TRINITY_DN7106_c0_g1_i2:388-2727(+)
MEELMALKHQLQQVEELQQRNRQLHPPVPRQTVESQITTEPTPSFKAALTDTSADRPVWDLSPTNTHFLPENSLPAPSLSYSRDYAPNYSSPRGQDPVRAFRQMENPQKVSEPLNSYPPRYQITTPPLVAGEPPKQANPAPAPPPPIPNWALAQFKSGASGVSESFMNQLKNANNMTTDSPIPDNASAITDGVESQITWLTPPPTPKNLPKTTTDDNVQQSPLSGSVLKEAIVNLSPGSNANSIIEQCPVDDGDSNGEEVGQNGACYNFDEFIVNNDDNNKTDTTDNNNNNSNPNNNNTNTNTNSDTNDGSINNGDGDLHDDPVPVESNSKRSSCDPSDSHTHPPSSNHEAALADVKTPPELSLLSQGGIPPFNQSLPDIKTPPELSLISQSVPQNLNFSDPNISFEAPAQKEESNDGTPFDNSQQISSKSKDNDTEEGNLETASNEQPNEAGAKILNFSDQNGSLLSNPPAVGSGLTIEKTTEADTEKGPESKGDNDVKDIEGDVAIPMRNPLAALAHEDDANADDTPIEEGAGGKKDEKDTFVDPVISEDKPAFNDSQHLTEEPTVPEEVVPESKSSVQPTDQNSADSQRVEQTNEKAQAHEIRQPTKTQSKTGGQRNVTPVEADRESPQIKMWRTSQASWVSTVQGDSTDESASPTAAERRGSWLPHTAPTAGAVSTPIVPPQRKERQPSWMDPSLVRQTTTDTRSNKTSTTRVASSLPASQKSRNAVPSERAFGDFGSFMRGGQEGNRVNQQVCITADAMGYVSFCLNKILRSNR